MVGVGDAENVSREFDQPCWKPPHVPRKGIPFSRAKRIAVRAPSMFAYGLPGTHQIALAYCAAMSFAD